LARFCGACADGRIMGREAIYTERRHAPDCRLAVPPSGHIPWTSKRRGLAIPQSADIRNLTAADFEARLREGFHLQAPDRALTLELAEVRRLGQAVRDGGAFSLQFVSAPGPFLPQAIYPLTHPVLGTFDLFIVPIGPANGGNGYEAVFA
jgi:hypothetical protein